MIARDIFPEHPDKDVLARSQPDDLDEGWADNVEFTDEQLDELWTEEQAFRAVHAHQHECGHDCTGVACRLYSYISPECLGCQRRRYGL